MGAGFESNLNNLKKQAGDLCTRALLENDTAFFKKIAADMNKVRSEVPQASHRIRRLLLHEASAGEVNLSQLAARLKKFFGITISVRSLSRIGHKHKVRTPGKGRPRKYDK